MSDYIYSMEKLYSYVYRAITQVKKIYAQAIFPSSCICCNAVTAALPLCAACADKTVFAPSYKQRCKICGRELISEIDYCTDCRAEQNRFPHITQIYPLYEYELWAKDALFQWKTADQRAFSFIFAQAVYRILCNQSSIFSGYQKNYAIPLIPVPPRQGKIRTKGWDQIEEATHLIEKCYAYPVKRLLKRTTTVQQKKLNKSAREAHSKTAFTLHTEAIKNSSIPSHVIIFDDIVTTGSTLNACADVLHHAGVSTIYAVTLFIV